MRQAMRPKVRAARSKDAVDVKRGEAHYVTGRHIRMDVKPKAVVVARGDREQ